MKFIIKHEIKGRLRIHVVQGRMTCAQADTLCWFLEKQEYVTDAKVYERTADAVICYKGDREEIVAVLKSFSYEKADVPENVLACLLYTSGIGIQLVFAAAFLCITMAASRERT